MKKNDAKSTNDVRTVPVYFLRKKNVTNEIERIAADYAQKVYGVELIDAPDDQYIIKNSFMLLAFWDGKPAVRPIDNVISDALLESNYSGEDSTQIGHTTPVYQVILPSAVTEEDRKKNQGKMHWKSRLLLPHILESGEKWYTLERAVLYKGKVIGDVEEVIQKKKNKEIRIKKISSKEVNECKANAKRKKKEARTKYGLFLSGAERREYRKEKAKIKEERHKEIDTCLRRAAHNIGIELYKKDRFQRNAQMLSVVNSALTSVCKKDSLVEAYDLFSGNRTIHKNNLCVAVSNIRHLRYDTIATELQSSHRIRARAIAFFAAFGLIGYGIFTDIASPHSLFGVFGAVLSVVFITLAVLLFLLNIWTKKRDAYLHLRLLSECLRTKTYFNAAGLTDKCVSDCFSERQQIELEWATIILRSWDVIDRHGHYYDKPIKDNYLSVIEEEWIGKPDKDLAERKGESGKYDPTSDGQLAFDRKRGNEFQREASRLNNRKTWTTILVVLFTLIVAGMTVGLYIIKNHTSFEDAIKHPFAELISSEDSILSLGDISVEDILVFVTGVLPAALACWLMYKETRMYPENAQRYKWMAIKYQKFLTCLDKADSDEEKRAILEKVGIAAAEEIGEWTILNADSDINLPF